MMLRRFLTGLACFLFLILGSDDVFPASIQLDFNDFSPGPPGAPFAVKISPDGLSATIYEDTFDIKNSPVFLKYDGFHVPATALSLAFEFELNVGADNEDYFDFYIGNPSEPAHEWGGHGASFTAGSFVYYLTDLAGSDAPVIFQLMSDFGETPTDSWVRISNVEVTLIPLPGTCLLLGSGLLGVMGLRRRKKRGQAHVGAAGTSARSH